MKWNNINRITIYMFSVFLFFGCTNSTNKKITRYLRDFECMDTCRVDLRQVLNVDYDKMYLFGESILDDDISSIIGQKYRYSPFFKNYIIPDSKYRIILLKDNKIVYEDDFYQRGIIFTEITNERDTINFANIFYLVHHSPFYLVTKSHGKNFYELEEVASNNNTRYYLRLYYGKHKIEEFPR